MGILISLHFISSTVTSLKQIMLDRVPIKKEVQPPLQLTQCQRNSEHLVWPSERLLKTEPPKKREYSPTPEEILLASLPDKREIKNPVLLTQRKPKSEKPGWPSKRLLITEPPWKRVYSPTPEEILLANLPDKREIKNPVLLTQRKPKSEKPGWPTNRLLLTEPPWKREYSPTPEEILLATLPEGKQQEPRYIGNHSLSTWKRNQN